MKTRTKVIAYAQIIIVAILATKVASTVIDRYEVVVNGISGLALIYLIYRVFLSAQRVEKDEPINVLLEFPKNVRYLILGFFWAVILYWGLDNTFKMVLYLKDLIF